MNIQLQRIRRHSCWGGWHRSEWPFTGCWRTRQGHVSASPGTAESCGVHHQPEVTGLGLCAEIRRYRPVRRDLEAARTAKAPCRHEGRQGRLRGRPYSESPDPLVFRSRDTRRYAPAVRCDAGDCVSGDLGAGLKRLPTLPEGNGWRVKREWVATRGRGGVPPRSFDVTDARKLDAPGRFGGATESRWPARTL
jgi:hypothetical protein